MFRITVLLVFTLSALTVIICGLAVVLPADDAPMLAFTSYRDGAFDVYLLDVNQRRTYNLTDHPADDYMPAWSADGRRLAWVSERGGGRDLYVFDFDDASTHRLTFARRQGDTMLSNYANPAWGPDDRLAYVRFDASPVPVLVIARVDADNILRNDASVNFGNSPQWSPDGTQIAFINQFGGDYFINLSDDRGNNVRQVSQSVRNGTRFHWTPDGTAILYAGTPSGPVGGQVMRLDVAREFNTPLMPFGETGQDAQAAPDGRIVFVRFEGTRTRLYTMSATGDAVEPLTTDDLSAYTPVWSPDGSQVAFLGATSSGAAEDIYVINADGGHLRQLTDDPGRDFAVIWRP